VTKGALLGKLLAGVEIGDVPLNGSHITADFGNGLIQLRLSAARNEDLGSLFDKALGGRANLASIKNMIGKEKASHERHQRTEAERRRQSRKLVGTRVHVPGEKRCLITVAKDVTSLPQG
jgi:hypothetical protein